MLSLRSLSFRNQPRRIWLLYVLLVIFALVVYAIPAHAQSSGMMLHDYCDKFGCDQPSAWELANLATLVLMVGWIVIAAL